MADASNGRVSAVGREERPLPHSVEAEQAVLGSLLLDNQAWIDVGDRLTDLDFFEDAHKCIFRHIASLLEHRQAADLVTVLNAIRNSNEVGQAGGLEYLEKLISLAPTVANVQQYVEIVREKSTLRSIIDACNIGASRALSSPGRGPQAVLDMVESELFKIYETRLRGPRHRKPLSAALGEAMDRVRTLFEHRNKGEVTGVAAGFIDLDKMTSGFQLGDLVVIAGSPGMGKTTLALNIAAHVSFDLGLPTLLFCPDNSATQIALRILALRARFDITKLNSADLTDEELVSLAGETQRMHDGMIYIDDAGTITVGELRAQVRRAHREFKGLGLIVIFDIQMIVSPRNQTNGSNDLGVVSREIKELAKELAVPVIVLSSISSKVDDRATKRPLLSDLGESSDVHQAADVVLLLYRDEYCFPGTSKGPDVTEVAILKNRAGATGSLSLTFDKEHCRFESLQVTI